MTCLTCQDHGTTNADPIEYCPRKCVAAVMAMSGVAGFFSQTALKALEDADYVVLQRRDVADIVSEGWNITVSATFAKAMIRVAKAIDFDPADPDEEEAVEVGEIVEDYEEVTEAISTGVLSIDDFAKALGAAIVCRCSCHSRAYLPQPPHHPCRACRATHK